MSVYQTPTFLEPATSKISFELYPPRSGQGVEDVLATVDALEALAPSMYSITCSTDRPTADTAARVAKHVLQTSKAQVITHMTCVGRSQHEASQQIVDALELGVHGILAVRGDLPAGVTKWRAAPDGIAHAGELTSLVRKVEARWRATSMQTERRELDVLVAAYPTGQSATSSLDVDLDYLAAKQRAGATGAITQVFFYAEQYISFVAAAREAGITLPIVPGILPIHCPKRLERLSSVFQVPAPLRLLRQLEIAHSDEEQRKIGAHHSGTLAQELLDAGAPGLHLFTFNRAEPALRILEHIDQPLAAAL